MVIRQIFTTLLIFTLFVGSCNQAGQLNQESSSEQSEIRPFTRWWWMGNAVTNQGITEELEAFKAAGLGGVEITPIYGVKGYEEQYITFLDSAWINRLEHTLDEAKRLGLSVDMNLGTGWPFGGPHIRPEHAARKMEIYSWSIADFADTIKLPQKVDQKARGIKLEAVVAVKGDKVLPLNEQVVNGYIAINEILKEYDKVYALVSMLSGQKVKRAAPGGEGYVIDHFNREAVITYLSRFEEAFAENNLDVSRIRCFFNDSYEVYGANWAANFLQNFQELHAYDFANYFYLLKDTTASDLSARIARDYRKTLEKMLQENFTRVVADWCHSHGVKFRNQAHGSPGNLLDLYAAVDIPETETFHSSNFKIKGLKNDTFSFGDRPNPLMLKFASSAAHVSGKPLVASETATWLDEHFTVSMKQIKPQVDHLFVNGINHVLYHGTAYSPADETWPGWLFYASTQLKSTNPWWDHVKALNDYIATCQTYLQNSKPDNDILIYWSADDAYSREKSTRLQQFTIHSEDWIDEDFKYLVLQLQEQGYTFDYISDDQLLLAMDENGILHTAGATYQTIIVPAFNFIPAETLDKLNQLAKNGVKVVYQNKIPNHFPGYVNRQKRPGDIGVARESIITDNVNAALQQLGIGREEMTDAGLMFIRKLKGNHTFYFLFNNSPQDVEQWIALNCDLQSATLLDPLSHRKGRAKMNDKKEVYLQLKSGQSLFLFTDPEGSDLSDWLYLQPTGESYLLDSEWQVNFTERGPSLPSSQNLDQLQSWHRFLSGTDRYFSGTASYTTSFPKPGEEASHWLLNLAGVHESAEVSLNGQVIDTVFSLPMEVIIPAQQLQENNTLKLRISNLMANRIIYMDQNQIEWRKFHEINFVNIHYQPFDASGWELQPSGLVKTPELVGMEVMD